jgi:hypothetical protein
LSGRKTVFRNVLTESSEYISKDDVYGNKQVVCRIWSIVGGAATHFGYRPYNDVLCDPPNTLMSSLSVLRAVIAKESVRKQRGNKTRTVYYSNSKREHLRREIGMKYAHPSGSN